MASIYAANLLLNAREDPFNNSKLLSPSEMQIVADEIENIASRQLMSGPHINSMDDIVKYVDNGYKHK